MRIYTKKGDHGTTSLLRGGRVSKDDARVSAFGDLDELSAVVGVAAAVEHPETESELLLDIQRDLLTIGSMLATLGYASTVSEDAKNTLDAARLAAIELAIDRATDSVLPLKRFVLPGGCTKAAVLHHARTVCRRAERSVVALSHDETLPEVVLPYLNRLSDLLFVLARLANKRAGIPDREW